MTEQQTGVRVDPLTPVLTAAWDSDRPWTLTARIASRGMVTTLRKLVSPPASIKGRVEVVISIAGRRKKAPISLSCSRPALNMLASMRMLRAGVPPLLRTISSNWTLASVSVAAARSGLNSSSIHGRGLGSGRAGAGEATR